MLTRQFERPISTSFKQDKHSGCHVIGVDIGGTNLRLALADKSGAILGRWSRSTTGARNENVIVELIREGFNALLAEASLPRNTVAAVAAGAPGITDTDQGIVVATSYLMGWRDVPLRALLEAALGVPVSIDNDVNLAALGEAHSGVAQGVDDFVFLGIGTGIGAGIVINGQLHRGCIWSAGEVGYMLVPGTSEALVDRGTPGPLEEIVGGQGIRFQWQSRWSERLTPLPQDAIATEIFDHALAGNALAQEVVQLAGRTLAYAIYNISLILNSPLFVLGGTVGMHPALGDAARKVLSQLGERVQPKLVASALGPDAQLRGAVFLAVETARNNLAPARG